MSKGTGDVAKNRRGVGISGEGLDARHDILFDGYLVSTPVRGMRADNLSQVNSPIVRLSASLAAILAENRLACCTFQTQDPEVLKVTFLAHSSVSAAKRPGGQVPVPARRRFERKGIARRPVIPVENSRVGGQNITVPDRVNSIYWAT